jgi:hypothetical protein
MMTGTLAAGDIRGASPESPDDRVDEVRSEDVVC